MRDCGTQSEGKKSQDGYGRTRADVSVAGHMGHYRASTKTLSCQVRPANISPGSTQTLPPSILDATGHVRQRTKQWMWSSLFWPHSTNTASSPCYSEVQVNPGKETL